MSHKCAAACCPSVITDAMLMCSSHWFLVPPDLRGRVTRAWQRITGARSALRYDDSRKEYLEAREAAVAAVARAVEPVR